MKFSQRISELTRRNIDAITRMDQASELHRTLGERVADGVTRLVGSWPFLLTQAVIFGSWVILNALAWTLHWDPYPFVLLNFLLSFEAAFASPIIMMSQNRQARLAERRNHLDLQINLLAEQESTEMLRLLRMLCEKTGVPLANEQALRALEEATSPENLVLQMEEAAEAEQKAE